MATISQDVSENTVFLWRPIQVRQPVRAQGGAAPTFAQLVSRVLLLETKTQFQSANYEARTTRFTGCNVYVQSGSGKTDDNASTGGALTGLGNLIVGYNGLRGS